jgi:hypothetical protein
MPRDTRVLDGLLKEQDVAKTDIAMQKASLEEIPMA